MNHPAPSPYPSAGEVIDGKYQIERVLGEGGMGMVARAYHLLLRAPVALKFMNPQFMTFPGAVERFINEGIASKRIRSDHVVPVDDVGKLATGAPYLVMPCLEGMDLADMLARDGTPGLPVERAIHFVAQILRGLQAAHAAGIIHRDMKPSNCFVVKHDGESDFIRILDFGISKVQQPGSQSLTQTNSALGTPLYMSPEQAKSPRDVDGRSDIYSVGVILYELLTGHTPFFSESGEFTEILFKLFTADPPPVKSTRPDLDDGLAEVVHKALAREPADRYATSRELAEALAPYAGERSKRVLDRIRTFKESEAASMPPPADMPLPPSMLAFSALDARPPTDIMANRPTTDVMKGPPVTEIVHNKPPKQQSTVALARGEGGPTGRSADSDVPPPSHISASPPDMATRARPDEAGARTQFDSGKAPPLGQTSSNPTGASTDLGAARDATMPGAAGSRSPMSYVLLGAAVLAIGGAAAFMVSSKPTTGAAGSASGEPTGDTSAVATTATATAPPPATHGTTTAALPTASTTTATADADAGTAAPETSAVPTGAVGVATSPTSPATAKRPPTTKTPHTSPLSTGTSVLDTDIKN